MLGATHALANPLTATYQIAHGQAIATMLPHVLRYNGEQVLSWYEELDRPPVEGTSPGASAVEHLASFVTAATRRAGLPVTLVEQGVSRESLPELAASAAQQWTAGFNPRTVRDADLFALYEAAFSSTS